MTPRLLSIAQSTTTPSTGSFSSVLELMALIAVGIGVLVGALLLLKNLRARTVGGPGGSTAAVSALEELRRLRDTGQITHREFEEARLKLIAKVSARMAAEKAAQADTSSGKPGARPVPSPTELRTHNPTPPQRP